MLQKEIQLAVEKGEMLPLMEEFYTIQGEGYHTGTAAYFIRIGGCDVGCHWCDVKESWNAELHPPTETDIIVSNAKKYSDTVVITGGEPLTWDMNPLTQKLKSVGNLKITEIPFVDKVYTRDIIGQETRNYDIKYITYENCNEYHSVVVLNIPEGKKFTEVPENKTFTFKKHSYDIAFELVAPNSLKITRIVKTPWDDITTTEYTEYKNFVEEVLAVEEQVVGFK